MNDASTLSVLDLVPVRSDQTTADAVAATLSLARTADELGYHRYWLAEHHNMPAVAATNPPVLIGLVAGATERIRVGLGRRDAAQPRAAGGRRAVRAARGRVPGPDRPRHRPGAGHRPGHLLRAAPRRRRGQRRGGHPLPGVRRQRARDDGARRASGSSVAGPHPRAAGDARSRRSVPTIWLLGSSDYSARLAAEKGLPYVFAHHFSGSGTAEALELYRSQLPALARARRAAHLPDRQRRGRRDRRRRPSAWRCPSC